MMTDLPVGSTIGGVKIVTEGSLGQLVASTATYSTRLIYPTDNRNKWTKLADIKIGRDNGYASGEIAFMGGYNQTITKTQRGKIRFRIKVIKPGQSDYMIELYLSDYKLIRPSDVAIVVTSNTSGTPYGLFEAGLYLRTRDYHDRIYFSGQQIAQFESQVTLLNDQPWEDNLPAGDVRYAAEDIVESFLSANTYGTPNRWARIGIARLFSDAKAIHARFGFATGFGSGSDSAVGEVEIRLRSRTTSPTIIGEIIVHNYNLPIISGNLSIIQPSQFVGVITSEDTTAGGGTVELFVQIPYSSERIEIFPIYNSSTETDHRGIIEWRDQLNESLVNDLPTGTQIVGRAADAYQHRIFANGIKLNPLSVQPNTPLRSTGLLAVANGKSSGGWNPLSISGNDSYLVTHNGSDYQMVFFGRAFTRTINADGESTSYQTTHGIGKTPFNVQVTPRNIAARQAGSFSVSYDSSAVTLTFDNPPTGSLQYDILVISLGGEV